jgi:hypothetical protein
MATDKIYLTGLDYRLLDSRTQVTMRTLKL